MHRPARFLLAAALLAFAALPAPADQAKARKKLDDEYIPFTEEKFFHYVFMGDRKMVGLFLEAGMPVDTSDDRGTALHRAAENDDPKLLDMLLKAGANVNARAPKGDTPLCRAASRGPAKNVQTLVAKGADVTAVCDWGLTALHDVAEKGDGALVALLVKAGAPLEARDEHADTPLAFAIKAEKTDALKALIAAGADVNAKMNHGETALHLAVGRRSLEAVKILLAAGAVVDARDGSGQTPLYLAANVDAVEVIPTLLAAGADPDAKDNSRESPKKIAERARSARAIELLKDAKRVAVAAPAPPAPRPAARAEAGRAADPKAELKRQGLSFDAETFWKRLEAEDARAVALFLKAGFDPATRNEMGRPPLWVAVEERHAALVPVLLEGGANPNDPGKSVDPRYESGDSILLRAIDLGDPDVLRALLAAKADPNKPNKYDATPIGSAITSDRADLLEILLKGGAKVGKRRALYLQIARSPAIKKLIKGAA